jgi:hypothetical protein
MYIRYEKENNKKGPKTKREREKERERVRERGEDEQKIVSKKKIEHQKSIKK